MCDLCARSWIFVLSTGRSGSTSLLEAINSLPGVKLSGENEAALMPALELYKRAKTFKNKKGAANEHGSVSLTSVLCSLQQTFLALDPATDATNAAVARGFKELMVPERYAGGKPSHLNGYDTEWLRFLDTLFPCAKIIFNIRANVTEQGGSWSRSSFMSSFYIKQRQAVFTAELEQLNKHVLHHHSARGGNKSYLIRLEDFSTGHFTKMAHWLGFPECTYTSLPHANDDSVGKKSLKYHSDYGGVTVECAGRHITRRHVASMSYMQIPSIPAARKAVVPRNPSSILAQTCEARGGKLGTHGIRVCCSSGCGECGGRGCDQRPGGAAECCPLKILESRRACANVSAPCVPY